MKLIGLLFIAVICVVAILLGNKSEIYEEEVEPRNCENNLCNYCRNFNTCQKQRDDVHNS